MRQELKSETGALFGLDLQRIVFVVGVVAEVTGIYGAASRSWMHIALCVSERRTRICKRRDAV
jgi:hypothetical protein